MVVAAERQLVRRRLLGWSLAFEEVHPGLDLGRDLVFGGEQRGLQVVEGIDNLAQSLQVALTTALGTDVFNINFGFDGLNALAEEPDPALARERVRVAAVQTLLKDPRVRRILDIQLDVGHDETSAAGQDSTERRIDRWRTAEVRVAFETVSGEQASVAVGGVLPGA